MDLTTTWRRVVVNLAVDGEIATVREAIRWQPPRKSATLKGSRYEIDPANADVVVANVVATPFEYAFDIRTETGTAKLTHLEMWGVGRQVLSDYVGMRIDAAAEASYNLRRTLTLTDQHHGSGYNEVNPGNEIEAYMEYLLGRHARPRFTGRLEWDPVALIPADDDAANPRAMQAYYGLIPGSQVWILDTGVPGFSRGQWWVEGGDLVYQAKGNPRFVAGINISSRDRYATVWETATATTAASTSWVSASDQQPAADTQATGKGWIIFEAQLPVNAVPDRSFYNGDDAVIRYGGRVWLERDCGVAPTWHTLSVASERAAGDPRLEVKLRGPGEPPVTVRNIRMVVDAD